MSVAILGVLVPIVSRRFTWWLGQGRTWAGIATVVGFYLLFLAATATYSVLR